MARDVSYLVKRYGTSSDDLEKFTDDEINKLVKICKEWGINPSILIEDYDLTLEILDFCPNENRIGGVFDDPNAIIFFVNHFVDPDHKTEKNPLGYLNFSYDGYLGRKKEISDLVLPEDQQDPRVKRMLSSLGEELAIYEPQLKGHRIAGLLWGSFYFGDPSEEPDLDFDFACCDRSDNPEDILGTISKELKEFFDIPTQCRTFNLDEYWQRLQDLSNGRYDLFGFGMCREHNPIISDTTNILLSKLIYLPFCATEPIKKRIDETRVRIDDVARRRPLVRALLMKEFDDTKKDRHIKKRPVYDR